MLEQPSGEVGLRDNSSYIRLNYRPRGWGENEGLSLTGFPVSADRFRLGYAYRISWGGSGIFTTRATAAGVPGVKLQLTRDKWYAFAGAKTALVLNDLIKEQESLYGFMAGAGVESRGDAAPGGRAAATSRRASCRAWRRRACARR